MPICSNIRLLLPAFLARAMKIDSIFEFYMTTQCARKFSITRRELLFAPPCSLPDAFRVTKLSFLRVICVSLFRFLWRDIETFVISETLKMLDVLTQYFEYKLENNSLSIELFLFELN